MIRVPLPIGQDWKTWARQLQGFLSSAIPNLGYKTADDNPSQDGTLLWDGENGYPVVSKSGAFEQVQIGPNEFYQAIWAEENAALGNASYEWAFGNGANTPSDSGVCLFIPSGYTAHIVAVGATTNNASGTSTIEASVNGFDLGVSDGVEVTLSGRSGIESGFTPYALSNGDRINFRTRLAGTNSSPSTAVLWIRFQQNG
jgi:hypothetical protein